jgi:ankyrin repeat protein
MTILVSAHYYASSTGTVSMPSQQLAFNFSIEQIKAVAEYIPEEKILPSKVEALWFLLELDNCECFIRGGQNFLRGTTEVVDYLCDNQVLLDFEKKTHHPVFTIACVNSPLEIIRILLQLRPSININERKRSAEEYETPLLAAIIKNRPHVVDFLLESGADPTLELIGNDWTPLFYAVIGRPDITRSLLKHIATKISHDAAVQYVNTRDDAGVTAFDTAVIGEFYEAAELLLEYKPNFLSFTSRYSDEIDALMNLLGHVFHMATHLEYLLHLLTDPLDGLFIDNHGATLLHAVVGVTIGMLHGQLRFLQALT